MTYQKKCKILALIVFASLFISPPASAYLDPGFGNMMWQLLVALAFSFVFTLKMFWMKIMKFFKRGENN